MPTRIKPLFTDTYYKSGVGVRGTAAAFLGTFAAAGKSASGIGTGIC